MFKPTLRSLARVAVASAICLVATPSSQAAPLKPIWHPELRQSPSVTDALAISAASSKSAPSTSASEAVAPAAAASGTRTCTSGWHFVQRDANSYVTGNCAGGWSMTVSGTRYETNTGWTYYSGNISGSYNGCGWMRGQDLGGSSGSASSGCGARAYCDFIYCDGAGNPYTYGDAYDGMVASALGGCREYGNFRPWSPSQSPSNDMRATTTGNTVRIRYLAKYVANDGHRYYMARDTTVPAEQGQANWVFIRDDCFS